MSNVIGSSLPAAQTAHVVRCWKCDVSFNAFGAHWCACDNPLRTLVCPHCSSCFCLAPTAYKRKFWSEAPRAMGHHKTRFRFSHRSAVPPNPARRQPATVPAEALRPRVLVVDDEEPMRSLVACYAEQLGYHVATATNGEEALAMLASSEFEVVLTDALMPKMDGRELCRIVKQSHGGRIKTVLMTSLYKASRFKTEARNRFGVDEYLTKPLHFTELRAALDRCAPHPVHGIAATA